MKLQKLVFMVPVVFLPVSSAAVVAAGDFDWIRILTSGLKLILQDSGQGSLPALI